jgi:hypothetical protein
MLIAGKYKVGRYEEFAGLLRGVMKKGRKIQVRTSIREGMFWECVTAALQKDWPNSVQIPVGRPRRSV